MKTKINMTYPPGSDKALDMGCECPTMDNGHGKGARGTRDEPVKKKVFIVADHCPLHGRNSK